MKKFMAWMEKHFTPVMSKVSSNTWIVSIKDAMMQILPITFLGSLFVSLTIPGDAFQIEWWPNFWTPFGYTMGLLSLLVSFLIPLNVMEKKRLRKLRIAASMTGLILFLIIIGPQLAKDGAIGFGHPSFGAGGMFIAMIAGLLSAAIFNMFAKFSFFKEDSSIPDFVRAWFDLMLPAGIVIVLGWIVVDLIQFDLYNTIIAVFMPLQNIIESPYGLILMLFITCFIYSMGISSWILQPITEPVMLAAIMANMTGGAANLTTSTAIYSSYLWIGGIGCTLPLVFMMMRSRVKKLKALGTASLVPGIFNINEPIVFGGIAWNPYLMVPFWLQGIILPIIMWVFTKGIAFAPIPKIQFAFWYCPFPLSTWLTTNGSIQALILMVAIFAVSTLIWFPFFKAYESDELKKEQEAFAGSAAKD